MQAPFLFILVPVFCFSCFALLTSLNSKWKVRNGKFFDKNAFVLDWENYLIRCPNGISLPFKEGTVVRFPKQECQTCPIRSQCTQSKQGRSISIHPDESLLVELRKRQTTESGRAKLRERVSHLINNSTYLLNCSDLPSI